MTQYDINFREYWRILKKRKTLVIFITVIFSIFFTIFAYLKAPTPIYTTDCLIEFERSPAIEDFYGKFDPSATDEIETQITMVKSYTVFEKVVEKLGLIPPGDMNQNGHLKNRIIATIESLRAKVEVEREGGKCHLDHQGDGYGCGLCPDPYERYCRGLPGNPCGAADPKEQ